MLSKHWTTYIMFSKQWFHAKKYSKMQKTWRSYQQNQSSTGDIDEPLSYPSEPIEVLMLWRHITKHCFKTPLKAITPLHDMHNMFPHPINADLPPQINGMKHGVTVNIAGNFLGSSQIDERRNPVYVSLLGGNIQVVPLPSKRPSLQCTTVEGPLIRLHTATTPFRTAQKQVRNTLGNYVYISKFTKHISCS